MQHVSPFENFVTRERKVSYRRLGLGVSVDHLEKYSVRHVASVIGNVIPVKIIADNVLCVLVSADICVYLNNGNTHILCSKTRRVFRTSRDSNFCHVQLCIFAYICQSFNNIISDTIQKSDEGSLF